MTEQQWKDLQVRMPIGNPVTGTIVLAAHLGVFVDLDPLNGLKHTALLEVIAFRSRKRPMTFPGDYPKVGDRIEARIAYYSTELGKIRLTQLEHDSYMET